MKLETAEKLINKLIPQKSEPIETYFTIDPNEEIFNKSFNQIEKEWKEEQFLQNKDQYSFTENGTVQKTDLSVLKQTMN